jgi:branched-chain amino acid transport system substrate-binding protein
VWPAVLDKLGVEILNQGDPITFTTEDRDFSSHVKRLLSYNPDGVCISALDKDAAPIAKEIRRRDSKVPLCGQNQSVSIEFIRIAGPAAEDFWAVGLFYPEDPNPKVQEYVEAFTKHCAEKYPGEACTPEQYDVVVYDTLHFIADIMKKRGITGDRQRLQEEREKIRDGLADMGVWRGTAGMMAFDKKGDGIRTIHVLKVKDGRWRPAY